MSLSPVREALDVLNQTMNELEFALNTQVQQGYMGGGDGQIDLFSSGAARPAAPSIDTAQLSKRLDQAIERVELLLKDAA